jgi:RNA polymerase sigma factor for flagellar operon FliA
LEHLPLVKAIAVRVHESLPVHVDLDDLVHAGILGLFDAAGRYNPKRKVLFSSYAKHRIKGAILDSLRELDWASRDLRKRQKQLEAITREMQARLGRAPTELEIAERLGVGLARWRRMMLELRSVGLLPQGSPVPEVRENYCAEPAATADSRPDHICAGHQLSAMLAHAIHTLPQRYQKVVCLYYRGEMTMREIAEILGVNESRVSQIHKLALEKMAVALHSAGIHSPGAF